MLSARPAPLPPRPPRAAYSCSRAGVVACAAHPAEAAEERAEAAGGAGARRGCRARAAAQAASTASCRRGRRRPPHRPGRQQQFAAQRGLLRPLGDGALRLVERGADRPFFGCSCDARRRSQRGVQVAVAPATARRWCAVACGLARKVAAQADRLAPPLQLQAAHRAVEPTRLRLLATARALGGRRAVGSRSAAGGRAAADALGGGGVLRGVGGEQRARLKVAIERRLPPPAAPSARASRLR